MWKKIDEQPLKGWYIFAAFIPVFIISALYFSPWQTHAIYGDDLYIYDIFNRSGDAAIINISQKYRPINNVLIRILIRIFNKNLPLYYYFNVLVQAAVVVVFIKIAHLVTRSITLSFISGIIIALSRFNLYNVTQLYNGGALEGLAMIPFLCCLLYLLRTLVDSPLSPSISFRAMLWSLFFANMAIYIHERYIVLFPVIALCTLMPQFRETSVNRRIMIIVLAILSIAVNYAIKKYIFHISFFMGTGNVDISFSPSSSYTYLKDGLCSILGINSGPEYLVGYTFSSLSFTYQLLVYTSLTLAAFFFGGGLIRMFVTQSIDADRKKTIAVLFVLLVLFIVCLIPAIITIRLEQRWLQASMAVYVLMLLVAINCLFPKNTMLKIGALSIVAILSITVNHNYLKNGANNIYLCNAHNKAVLVKQAIETGIIKEECTTLAIYEKKKDINNENEINWIVQNGLFFEFYGQRKKEIVFVDSTDKTKNIGSSPIDITKTQIIYITHNVVDITDKYMSNYFTY